MRKWPEMALLGIPQESSKVIFRREPQDVKITLIRTSSTTTRDRNCNFGAPSPLEALHWIFCFFSSIYVQFSKTSSLKSGESSAKSRGENRVKSCHVCGCHGFFGPDLKIKTNLENVDVSLVL